MNKRINIKRDTSKEVREFLAEQISKSIIDIRGEYPKEISNIVESIDFSTTQLRELPVIDNLLREKTINYLLDLLYIDSLIQYSDIFELQDILYRIRSIFDSTFISMINTTGELSSKVKDFITLSSRKFSFTDVVHETFNSQSNKSQSLKKLSINPAAGILRLDSEEEQYGTLEKSNIKIVPISHNIRQVDITDSSLAYLSDPTDPYYITLVTNTIPYNPNYPKFSFGEYNGAIVDVVITFTGIFPITRACFAPFSSAPIEIIGVFYADIIGSDFSSSALNQVEIVGINYDNAEVELNFERIYARELHILIKQDKFILSQNETDISLTYGSDEYIDHCSKALRTSVSSGFTETKYIDEQIKQLLLSVSNNTALPTEKYNANTRAYIIGLYGIKVSNNEYKIWGEYESDIKSLRGNLSSVSLAFNGKIYKSINEGIEDTTALFSIITAQREVFLGIPYGDNIVDAVTIEQNQKYIQGTMVQSESHRYKFDTHFIPDENKIEQMKMYADGVELNTPEVSSSGMILNRKDYTLEIELPTNFIIDNKIYNGSVLTVKYDLAEIDRFGRSYDIVSADILSVVGKPNISDNTAADIFSQYIYTTQRNTSGVVLSSISYEANEYSSLIIDGDLHYCIYSGKGETPNNDIVLINDKLYVNENAVVGPLDDFYYGSISEEPELISSGHIINNNTYYKFKTETPYVKDTIKAFREGYYIPDIVEYDIDISGTILSNDEKKEIWIPEESGQDIKLSYIPVDNTYVSQYIDTNIAQFNHSERFSKTSDKKIQLSRFPYIDKSIISSNMFDYSAGVFSLKYKYSIVYEPISIYVNGIKALNVTEYRTGNKPEFPSTRRSTDYRYYIENGNTIVFSDNIAGNIIIYYYILSDSFSTKMRLFRSNYNRNDITPELFNYTVLANVQR